MLQNESWSLSLGRFLARAGTAVLSFLRIDMIETKWGRRVMDQIFREGKFSDEEHPAPCRH